MVESQCEQLFTFSKLVAPPKLPSTLFSNILHDLSDRISVVWDFQLDPEDLCLRYSDLTGDAVDSDSLYLVLGGVQAFRPEWCRIQDDGFNSFLFTDFTQP